MILPLYVSLFMMRDFMHVTIELVLAIKQIQL